MRLSPVVILAGLLVASPAASGAVLDDLIAATGSHEVSPDIDLIARANALLDAIEREIGAGRPTLGRARRLHRLLHARHLREYDAGADGLHHVLDRGRFNCLSGTLLYALAARRLGFAPTVLEAPGHLRLRLRVAGHDLDVETTHPEGFDLGRLPWGRGASARHAWLQDISRAAPATPHFREVSLEVAIGFAWINAAWRALQTGRAETAAAAAQAAERVLPGSPADRAGVRRLLGEAFQKAYEKGCLPSAHAIARIDVALHPDSTTSVDRLRVTALKRATAACELDAPDAAESILDETFRMVGRAGGGDEIERRAWPCIAAAWVRLGDWQRAGAAVGRFAAVERDPVEAQRLQAWLEQRHTSSSPDAGRRLILRADFPGPLD